MKKLPSIYQNDISKKIKNNREVTYIKNENNDIDEINNIINSIFSGTDYVYNIPLIIKTKDKVYNTSLISKTKTTVMTLHNELIPIEEIISIERKKF